MIVTKEQYRNRMATCEACPHYVESTKSCGPFLIGKKVEVKDGKKKSQVKLCGCVMPIKAQLAAFGCPVGKWERTMTRKEMVGFKAFLDRVWGSKRLEDMDIQRLREYSMRLTGTIDRPLQSVCRNCGTQMAQYIEKLRLTLKDQGY